MYKKILVPLDGSVRAEKILPHVENLAKVNGSEVVFLRVVQPIIISDGYKGVLVDESQGESQRQVDTAIEYLSEIEGQFKKIGIKTDKISMVGSIVTTIIEVSQNENIDLIAMASHGRTGLSRVFYGSVAAGVLNAVDRPLLLIRSQND
ncbi:MAG: universal stress protein [Desulfobacterales bacterium]